MTFPCNYCKSPEKLKWPENWVKGVRPVNSETGKTHECETKSTFLFTIVDVVRRFTPLQNLLKSTSSHAGNVLMMVVG